MKLSILYFCIIIIIGFASCNEEEKETSITTFSIDTYCEVMLGDTLNIPIVNGSGELDILKSNDEFAKSPIRKKIITTSSEQYLSLGDLWEHRLLWWQIPLQIIYTQYLIK